MNGNGDFRIHFGAMHRTRTHKLCVYHGHPHGELFDLEADPWEFDHLCHSSRAVLAVGNRPQAKPRQSDRPSDRSATCNSMSEQEI